MTEFFILIGAVSLSGFIGAWLGDSREMRGKGLLLGLFLGPIGWILIVFRVGWFVALLVFLLVGFVVIKAVKDSERDKDEAQALQAR